MEIADRWTGRTARLLQNAFRMTNDEFAERLGISTRTVVRWHASPALEPRTEMQQLLDMTYERADESVRKRFWLLNAPPAPPEQARPQAQALRVAIAVVVRGDDVLLVCRRGDADLSWQFPAGMVKPGGSIASVAVTETHAETGVHCAVRDEMGSRVHPQTGVLASYALCDYLAGEATNRDAVENVDVAWVPRSALTRFIPADRIYPPILAALEAA